MNINYIYYNNEYQRYNTLFYDYNNYHLNFSYELKKIIDEKINNNKNLLNKIINYINIYNKIKNNTNKIFKHIKYIYKNDIKDILNYKLYNENDLKNKINTYNYIINYYSDDILIDFINNLKKEMNIINKIINIKEKIINNIYLINYNDYTYKENNNVYDKDHYELFKYFIMNDYLTDYLEYYIKNIDDIIIEYINKESKDINENDLINKMNNLFI